MRNLIALIGSALLACTGANVQARNVTLVTHGLDSDASGWVLQMASSIRDAEANRGEESDVYFVRRRMAPTPLLPVNEVSQVTFTSTNGAKNIVIAYDWRDYAKSRFLSVGVEHDNPEVGPDVANLFLLDNVLPGVSTPLGDSYVHLIGHSRGGSLVCGVSSILSRSNVVVAQLTTLDPRAYPLSGDYPEEAGSQVIFADNYYQSQDPVVHGVSVPKAANRKLELYDSLLVPGFPRNSAAHENVHHWYQRTIKEWDLSPYDASIRPLLVDWFEAEDQGGTRSGYFFAHCDHGSRPPDGFLPRTVSRPALLIAGGELAIDGLSSGPYRLQSSRDLRTWADTPQRFNLDGLPFAFPAPAWDHSVPLLFRLRHE